MRLTSVGRSVDTPLKTEMHFVHGSLGNTGFLEKHILNENFLNSMLSACE